MVICKRRGRGDLSLARQAGRRMSGGAYNPDRKSVHRVSPSLFAAVSRGACRSGRTARSRFATKPGMPAPTSSSSTAHVGFLALPNATAVHDLCPSLPPSCLMTVIVCAHFRPQLEPDTRTSTTPPGWCATCDQWPARSTRRCFTVRPKVNHRSLLACLPCVSWPMFVSISEQ